MIVNIKCNQCLIEMGSIEKLVITEQDIAEYKLLITCPNGHTDSDIDLEEQE